MIEVILEIFFNVLMIFYRTPNVQSEVRYVIVVISVDHEIMEELGVVVHFLEPYESRFLSPNGFLVLGSYI